VRILIVTNGLRFGGAERIVEATAVGLLERGDDVSVVATTRGGPIRDRLRAAGVPVRVLHIASPADGRVALELALMFRRFRPHVVHSHLAVADIATAAAGLVVPGPQRVTTVHNTGIELDRVKKGLWGVALRRFDAVLAVSDQVRRSLAPGLGAETLRPSLVEPGDTPPDRGAARSEARARLGLPDDVLVVMAVGRLVPIKGFDVLRAAAERLRTPGVRLVVIGEGPEQGRLAGGRLELVGARPDAAALLAAADVVCCPSRSEGFPQIPLEAMAASRPVVATRVGGTPESVLDGATGLLVPPEDPGALAAALDRVLGDRAWADALGAAGRDRLASEGLSCGAMVDRTRAVYRRLLARPDASRS
jgi:glycosyltransferase involved in cell wall biosynthesis